MTIRVDIPTHFLPDDHQVFVLHPGAKKRFYADFLAQGLVFLDLPGIQLPADTFYGRLADPVLRAKFSMEKPLIAQLRMSDKIAKWHRRGAPPEKPPVRVLKDYLDKVTAADFKLRFVSEFEGLYVGARKGDLVVSAGEGYMSGVLIGEFQDDGEKAITASSRRYPGEPIPARRVRWLSTDVRKAAFSDRLIQLMQNRQALIKIHPLDERREIYRIAYKDFTIAKEAVGRILIKRDRIDLRNLSKSVDVAFYFSAMFIAQEQGKLTHFVTLGIDEAIDSYYRADYFADTSISINSPGEIALKAKNIILPTFIGVMMALAVQSVTPDAAMAADFVNSASGTLTACHHDIRDRVRDAMNMMNYDIWLEMCKRSQDAIDAVGMDSPVTVTTQSPVSVPVDAPVPAPQPKQ